MNASSTKKILRHFKVLLIFDLKSRKKRLQDWRVILILFRNESSSGVHLPFSWRLLVNFWQNLKWLIYLIWRYEGFIGFSYFLSLWHSAKELIIISALLLLRLTVTIQTRCKDTSTTSTTIDLFNLKKVFAK